MFIYKNKYVCEKYPHIAFLCGNKFIGEKKHDKRSILKNYIKENISDVYPIILEENFMFKKTNQSYLSYDDIFLKNLFEVEKLASIFADKIIIIHETLSTAAELGMFANNIDMMQKICLLVPDAMSIEEDKITSFIRLAYLNSKTPNMQIREKIVYYPDIDIIKFSEFKSDYRTCFHENEIGSNLGNKILAFFSDTSEGLEITFNKNRYDKQFEDKSKIAYTINKKLGKINIYVSSFILKLQLLSLFFVDEFKESIRETKPIKDHINFINQFYNKIMLNTVCHIEGLDVHNFTVHINPYETLCTLNQSIGYFIYMLQGANLIHLDNNNPKDYSIRKVRISNELKTYIDYLGKYIEKPTQTSFGEIDK